jgi:hypothetical protein
VRPTPLAGASREVAPDPIEEIVMACDARRHVSLLAWFGVAALCACSPTRGKRAVASDLPPVVVFENQSLAQAAVYAVAQSGSEVRIGTVQPGRTDTLTLRATALRSGGPITLFARLLAMSRTPSSGSLTLRPGELIRVTLSPDARMLSVLPGSE